MNDTNNSARVLPSGAIEVDAGKLLTSPKVRRDLEEIEALYQQLKASGYDVVSLELIE